jgi:hypothetical protein
VQPSDPERIRDIFEYIQVRVETKPVHDERDTPFANWQIVDAPPANPDITAICRKESRDNL